MIGRPLTDKEAKYAQSVFYDGKIKMPFKQDRVSVIGSRNASKHGLDRAKAISKLLAENDVTVVSGLARGIDTEAHTIAIDCMGSTVAVLGTPLNKTYPSENAELQTYIMENHMAISQYPVGHATTPKDFAIRNRIMALISDATVIVEAGESSGSLYHGWESIRLGRPLLICKENEHRGWAKKMVKYDNVSFIDDFNILKHDVFTRTYL